MNEALKAARLSKGYTQAQMARMLGYKHRSGYWNIERGVNKPSVDVAIAIARILDKPVEELFQGLKVHET